MAPPCKTKCFWLIGWMFCSITVKLLGGLLCGRNRHWKNPLNLIWTQEFKFKLDVGLWQKFVLSVIFFFLWKLRLHSFHFSCLPWVFQVRSILKNGSGVFIFFSQPVQVEWLSPLSNPLSASSHHFTALGQSFSARKDQELVLTLKWLKKNSFKKGEI